MTEMNHTVRVAESPLKVSLRSYAVAALLTASLYLTGRPALGALAAIIAVVVSLEMLGALAARRIIPGDRLREFLILVGGSALFCVIFGAHSFFRNLAENLAVALPALLCGLLLYNIERLAGPQKRFAASLLFSVALVLFSIQYLLTMNLKIRPRVSSLKEGHDAYLASLGAAAADSPNVLLILMDDLGYGDLPAYGNTLISTPNLDFLAEHGVVMDNFFAAAPVCTPSRFAVLTGRYPDRGHLTNVLMPTVQTPGLNISRYWNPLVFSRGVDGILPDEITMAEALKAAGYRTGLFGKWHLGDYGSYRPNEQGFDHFYGSYYSNDMHPYEYYRNDERVIAHPLDQTGITRNLTDEIIAFINGQEDQKFYIHYASPWPHFPIHVSEGYRGASAASTYGDCLQEFDAGLGEILQVLREKDLLDDTLIIFTSDNGPWHEGSTGGLRGRKGNSFAGGHRVPFIACFPKEIPPGRREALPAMNIDLLPTILGRCGLAQPADRIIDGVDLWPVLCGWEESLPRDCLFFTRGGKVSGVLGGGYKYFDRVRCENSSYFYATYRDMLFDVEKDPAEAYDVKGLHPGEAEKLRRKLLEFRFLLETNPRGRVEP